MQQEPDAPETQKVATTPAEPPRERFQNSNLMPSDVPEWVHLNDGLQRTAEQRSYAAVRLREEK